MPNADDQVFWDLVVLAEERLAVGEADGALGRARRDIVRAARAVDWTHWRRIHDRIDPRKVRKSDANRRYYAKRAASLPTSEAGLCEAAAALDKALRPAK